MVVYIIDEIEERQINGYFLQEYFLGEAGFELYCTG